MTIKYVELFAGIGGFRQALDKVGGKCVFASEIDKFAAQSYEALYGEAPAGDITAINAADIPDHDVLVGGFPCQAFSVAGKRGGFDDTRGTLFFEIVRIAREKQPKLMLLENVKGLIGHDGGRTLDTMVTALAEIGYAVDFEVLNSKYYGVPQNRERIFIVAVRADIADIQTWDIPKARKDVVAKGKRRIAELDGVLTFNFDYPQQSEVMTRLRDILETDVDERYYLSDDKTAKLVAQLEAKENRSLLQGKIGTFGKVNEYSGNGAGPTLTATCYKEPDMILESEPQMVGSLEHYGNDQMNRVYGVDGVSPTITVVSGGGREQKIAVQMNRNSISHESDISHCLMARDYKGFGNQDMTGIIEREIRPVLTPDRMEKRQNGRRFKDDGEEAFTLTSQDKHGVAIGEYPRYLIRKLTPLECWRLQGFSDEAHEAVKAAGVSDSQRYKQAGNAVTVNVIKAIAERLLPILHESRAEAVNA